MPQITVNQLTYHYTRQGSGPALALLHGFTGSTTNWQPFTARFAEHFTVIAIDLPGHGQTDKPTDPARYGMAHVAQDLTHIFASLELGRVHLLGYSMGGRLALYLAAHHPAALASLTLESASPGLDDPAARADRVARDEQLAAEIEAAGVAAFVARWEQLPLFASQQQLPARVQERLRTQRLNNTPQGLANSLRGMGTGVQPALWPRLGAIELPVLLLAGALDAKFAGLAGQMAARLPDVRQVIVPETGHTVHLEQPEIFADVVLEFLGNEGARQ